MTREEIKNKLYYVADTIKMNADKFANGEALENEDWIKAAKEFSLPRLRMSPCSRNPWRT